MANKENMPVRGFVRGALIDPDGTVHMGEWAENVITNVGYESYILGNISHVSTTTYPVYIALSSATSTTPAATDTGLASECTKRSSATTSIVSSKTLQMLGSWASNECTGPISGIAVFAVSSASSGSAGSIASFASSSKSDNQTFAVTYQWRFA